MPGRVKIGNPVIRVTNLPEELEEKNIREIFREFGNISRIVLPRDRSYSLITFNDQDSAQRAIDSMNGSALEHLIIRVEWA